MDSFDLKLLEIISQTGVGSEYGLGNPSIRVEVQHRINKVLNKYFVFVLKDRIDSESENSWQRPVHMYSIVNGTAIEVNYSNLEQCWMLEGTGKIPWEKVFRTQKEAIDSVTTKKKKK